MLVLTEVDESSFFFFLLLFSSWRDPPQPMNSMMIQKHDFRIALVGGLVFDDRDSPGPTE